MSKVEELRERLIQAIGTYGVAEDKGMPSELCETLDSLIAAANEEGCDDGWAASKMLWTRMQQWNDEWRAENPKERSLTLLDAMDLIEWKIAKARAEGAEAERAAMRANSGFLAKGSIAASDNCFDDVMQRESGEFATVAVCDCYVTPAAVLSPAPKEEKP